MGTTLTGTTPQDTYDSLIKVTDNGPLTGSLKVLTDGLGNNSALALSTGAIQLTGTNSTAANNTTTGFSADLYAMAVRQRGASAGISGANFTAQLISAVGTEGLEIYTPNAKELVLGTNALERMRITSAGNVGIGISAPTEKLSVAGNIFMGGTNANIFIDNGGVGGAALVVGVTGSTNGFVKTDGAFPILIQPNGTTRVRIDSDGLKFNADTAAANALDDYEEGTWTIGVSFGGASVGVTTNANTGTYTKVGRQVTVNGRLTLTSKGSSSGAAAITGLPFTIPNSESNRSVASLRFADTSFANQFQSFAIINTTTIRLEEITEAGTASSMDASNFANNSDIMISFTYFV